MSTLPYHSRTAHIAPYISVTLPQDYSPGAWPAIIPQNIGPYIAKILIPYPICNKTQVSRRIRCDEIDLPNKRRWTCSYRRSQRLIPACCAISLTSDCTQMDHSNSRILEELRQKAAVLVTPLYGHVVQNETQLSSCFMQECSPFDNLVRMLQMTVVGP
ncbi:hypothetical protein NM688_g8031 [Phlebia brevispora]|uniref:Uncharacterized protein n=1 Tax=Phlebia brevispora TaxID=194682 RepID=A0ACC1RYE0_9APHY|nr:hypothetical protein NM688_g8031 [Phlebia brevispora]